LKFVGRIDDKIVDELKHTLLSNNINFLGYKNHKESLYEMQNSDVLLITNFPAKESKGIIPGKLFEYLATGNTILSFGPPNADVSNILTKTQAGQHFTYKADKQNLKNFILSQFEIWKYQTIKKEIGCIDKFSRKNLTKKLVEVIEVRS
jgi:glycosyltransferase involved in cell wall biosynthesis